MKAYMAWAWAGIKAGLGWAWERLTWGNALAVVNPRFDLKTAKVVMWIGLWAALAAVVAGLVVGVWLRVAEYPRLTAELVGLAVLLRTVAWGRRAQVAGRAAREECDGLLDQAAADLTEAQGELIRRQAAFDARVAAEVANQVTTLATEKVMAETERDEAVLARTDAEDKLREATARLDLSGQFFAVCLRWNLARKSKKAAPVVGGVKLDEAYWYKEVERVAKLRWPGVTWRADELAAAAVEVAEQPDLARWRRVVNSQFGLTLPTV